MGKLIKKSREVISMEQEGNFAVGFSWGVSLSIPFWISILGWIKIILSYL
jgi:hypothetical protein